VDVGICPSPLVKDTLKVFENKVLRRVFDLRDGKYQDDEKTA
jgi:hypothetical protein